MPLYGVRPPVSGDAAVLGALQVELWRSTYRGLMPDEVLDGLDEGHRIAQWRDRIDRCDQDGRLTNGALVQVGTADRRPVGFATAGPAPGPSRSPEQPAPHWELYALYLDRAHHGSQLAELLLATTVGPRNARLWVLRGNERAIAFYRKHGFAETGRTHLDADTRSVHVEMVRGCATSTGC